MVELERQFYARIGFPPETRSTSNGGLSVMTKSPTLTLRIGLCFVAISLIAMTGSVFAIIDTTPIGSTASAEEAAGIFGGKGGGCQNLKSSTSLETCKRSQSDTCTGQSGTGQGDCNYSCPITNCPGDDYWIFGFPGFPDTKCVQKDCSTSNQKLCLLIGDNCQCTIPFNNLCAGDGQEIQTCN